MMSCDVVVCTLRLTLLNKPEIGLINILQSDVYNNNAIVTYLVCKTSTMTKFVFCYFYMPERISGILCYLKFHLAYNIQTS